MTPGILYGVIAVLGVVAVGQIILARGVLPEDAHPPIAALILLVVLENLYYGTGRMLSGLYVELALYLPAVLTFKVGYIVALAYLNTRLLAATRHR